MAWDDDDDYDEFMNEYLVSTVHCLTHLTTEDSDAQEKFNLFNLQAKNLQRIVQAIQSVKKDYESEQRELEKACSGPSSVGLSGHCVCASQTVRPGR